MAAVDIERQYRIEKPDTDFLLPELEPAVKYLTKKITILSGSDREIGRRFPTLAPLPRIRAWPV